MEKGDKIYMAEMRQGKVYVRQHEVLAAGPVLVRASGYGRVPIEQVATTPAQAVERLLTDKQAQVKQAEEALAHLKAEVRALEAKALQLVRPLEMSDLQGPLAREHRASFVGVLKERRGSLATVLALLPPGMRMISRVDRKTYTVAELREKTNDEGEGRSWYISLGTGDYGRKQWIQVCETAAGFVYSEQVQ